MESGRRKRDGTGTETGGLLGSEVEPEAERGWVRFTMPTLPSHCNPSLSPTFGVTLGTHLCAILFIAVRVRPHWSAIRFGRKSKPGRRYIAMPPAGDQRQLARILLSKSMVAAGGGTAGALAGGAGHVTCSNRAVSAAVMKRVRPA